MKQSNEELMRWFDGLTEYLKTLPRATVKLLDGQRYQRMHDTARKLDDILRDGMNEGCVVAEVKESHNAGVITAELDDLTVFKPYAFAEVIAAADNFEIYPLTNGKLRLSILFRSMLTPLAWEPAQEEKMSDNMGPDKEV